MDSLLYWIWLSLRCGAGNESASFLLSEFGTPENVYNADERAIFDALGKENAGLCRALSDKDLEMPRRILEYCHRMNIGIMTLDSEIYPQRLRSIYAKPIVLYYKGKIPNIDKNVLISCVGMRKCSDKGARIAYKLGAELASAGAIVVSGMALGIDTMCSRGALSVKGHTIAVLGCGIDIVYPPENKLLMKAIEENGTIITEYAPGMKPLGKHFPIRNRIISGLSLGTVVVEAMRFSGALITAEYAKKQGRDIFAFPGDVENVNYAGTNFLISDGAKMARGAQDVLSEYSLVWHDKIFIENISARKYYTGNEAVLVEADEGSHKTALPPASKYSRKRPKKIKPDENKEAAKAEGYLKTDKVTEEKTAADNIDEESPKERAKKLTGLEKEVYDAISGTISSDDIAAAIKRKTGENVDVSDIIGVLTSLEIDGLCVGLPGGLFSRT
ncbi:MAG: DNA-processing protein DprA [Eubacteriales bacterium]